MNEKSYAKECGLRCSRLRMAQGMSQQELAEKVFTTAQNISKYEKNGISNIDMIRKISDALGHDLLVDEMDEEGVVGEVGKEILWKLIEAGGYKAVSEMAAKDMYGMNMSRVNQEIFKLEHIGMCVREQYVDFDELTKDMLFVTAKGVITYKSLIGRSVLNNRETEAIGKTVSYEKLLEGADSYQDFVNRREVEKMIRSIRGFDYGDYRINYIHYLKSHFEKGISPDKNRIDSYLEKLVPEHGFYFDLIYRMAMHYDSETYNALLSGEYFDPAADEALERMEEQCYGTPQDFVIGKAERDFEECFPKIKEIDMTDEGLLPQEPFDEERQMLNRQIMQYWIESEEVEAHYEHPEKVFLKSLEEGHTTPYPTRWFTTDEIRAFIEENLHPAASEEERKLDEKLTKINAMDPRTLDYYKMPAAWEENGLAQMVRDLYGLSKETE